MKRDYHKDTFDLKDLDKHNEIEHDASLIRACDTPNHSTIYLIPPISGEDTHFEPDQSKIATALIEELLNNASGKDEKGEPVITSSDLANALSQRLADSKASNPEFTTSFLHRMFGAGKCVSYF